MAQNFLSRKKVNAGIEDATGLKAVFFLFFFFFFFFVFDFFVADYFKRLLWCVLCLLRSDIGMLLSTRKFITRTINLTLRRGSRVNWVPSTNSALC